MDPASIGSVRSVGDGPAVPRPPHLSPALVGVVAVGGAVGTAARHGLSHGIGLATGPPGWPVATFTANLLGTFLLGALLEALLRGGTETPRGRLLRLGVGTGVLGGFTTVSGLALEVERMLADGAVPAALAYGVGSVVCGVAVCLLGVVAAARHHTWRDGRLPRDPDAAERLDGPAAAGDAGRAVGEGGGR